MRFAKAIELDIVDDKKGLNIARVVSTLSNNNDRLAADWSRQTVQEIPAAVQNLIDEAYTLFGPVDHERYAITQPPRDLGLERLRDLVGQDVSAMELRWCLPRLLQAIACRQTVVDAGFCYALDGFALADSSRWRAEERRLFGRFCIAFLDQLPPNHTVLLDDAICLFARAGIAPQLLFDRVGAWPITRLVDHLWHDWCGMRLHELFVGEGWPDPQRAHAFYASDRLYGTLIDHAVDPETSPDAADRALALVAIIDSSDYFNRPVTSLVTAQAPAREMRPAEGPWSS
ncbi:MAG: hypothetical protein AAF367_05375 [Pseudomonadota bacterium]